MEEKAKIEATAEELDEDDESIGGLGRQIRKLSSRATEEFCNDPSEPKMESKIHNSARIQQV